MRPPTRMPPDEAARLQHLIDALVVPSAYPHPVEAVEVHQTHISVVFLAGAFAYKIKKPVSLPFVDYHTLDRRLHFCHEEVRLNRRLALEVYLGVVAIRRDRGGRIRIEGDGDVVEWAVRMRRLPVGATLAEHLERGELSTETVVALARRIASFHETAATSAVIAEGGRFPLVARQVRENLEETRASGNVGRTISAVVFDRITERLDQALGHRHGLIEDRASRGKPRDTHGDLRLDHVYLRTDPDGPNAFWIVDGVEFSERLRFADPVADAAFPVMELAFAGRRDLARVFAEAYFEASGDDEGRALLPLYVSYRAAVRAKVGGLLADEAEVPEADRHEALRASRAYWLLALDAVEEPDRRPLLVLVMGLPGVGKSTLAHALAARARFDVIRSDVVRKTLATELGVSVQPAGFEQGIYAPEWTERTYEACLDQARRRLFEGRRVVLDASFGQERRRAEALAAARSWGVPAVLFHLKAGAQAVHQRLAARSGQGDASDADGAIHVEAAARWEPMAPTTAGGCLTIDASAAPEAILAAALGALRDRGYA